jgi:hypothetical protein
MVVFMNSRTMPSDKAARPNQFDA